MKNQLTTALCIIFTIATLAQEKPEVKKEIPKGEVFSSTQSVTINGKTIALSTETGTYNYEMKMMNL